MHAASLAKTARRPCEHTAREHPRRSPQTARQNILITVSDAAQREGHDGIQDHLGTRWTSRTKVLWHAHKAAVSADACLQGRGSAPEQEIIASDGSRSSLVVRVRLHDGTSKPARRTKLWIGVHAARPDKSRGPWAAWAAAVAWLRRGPDAGSMDVPRCAGRPCSSSTWCCPRRGTCTSRPAVHIAPLA